MKILIMLFQFILGLSIIVGIHELGHLIFAKIFGMRVESYTIGFPPKIFKFKWGETEYSLGALPFGGAVKIAGMIDESLDTEHVNNGPQPWEFRAKPAWQRLIVMLGGIILNAISGICIYVILTFVMGDTYLTKEEVNKYGIIPNEIGRSLGFEEGDQIINIQGHDFTNFNEVFSPTTLQARNGYYTIKRNEALIQITIPPELIDKVSQSPQMANFIMPRIPFNIESIQTGSPAELAGLQVGDRIISINKYPTTYFNQLQDLLKENAGKKIEICYQRRGQLYHTITTLGTEGKLGFCSKVLIKHTTKNYSLGEALVIGTQKAVGIVYTNLLGLIKIITGKLSASKSLSGPIGIAQVFGNQFDWIHFWTIVGLLSMVLAFTNLLPIPALDGGHVVLVLYELITGRKVPEKILMTIQKVGIAILVFLISYSIFNDLRRLL